MAANPSVLERLDNAEVTEPSPKSQPQPLVREIPPGLRYPVEALGPLRAAAEAVQSRTQAPVAIPAQSALSVAALAVQGFADVETLGGYRPTSLYCLTIAASGERKSSCDAPLMQTVHEFERQRVREYAEARKEWVQDHSIWKTRHESVLTAVRKGKASKADLAALGLEPATPPLPYRLVSEPTYEGLTKLFAEGQPSLGLFSDEGGQFLGGHAMSQDNRQKTLAAFNSLWMGDPIKRTRQGDGATALFGRRLSLHLMVQPGVARAFLSDPMASDTGFLPRCLTCEPVSTIGTRLHCADAADETALAHFGERLDDILNTAMAMDPETRELRPRRLTLSPAAREALIAFSDAVERSQAPGGECEQVRGHASKAAEQACRIAGVLTLWADLSAPEVPAAAMANGIALARFYLSEAQRLAGMAAMSDSVAKAEDLRLWMLSGSWGKPWLTVTDAMQRGPNRLRERDAVTKAIAMLFEAGWLEPMPQGTVLDGKARRHSWKIIRD